MRELGLVLAPSATTGFLMTAGATPKVAIPATVKTILFSNGGNGSYPMGLLWSAAQPFMEDMPCLCMSTEKASVGMRSMEYTETNGKIPDKQLCAQTFFFGGVSLNFLSCKWVSDGNREVVYEEMWGL